MIVYGTIYVSIHVRNKLFPYRFVVLVITDKTFDEFIIRISRWVLSMTSDVPYFIRLDTTCTCIYVRSKTEHLFINPVFVCYVFDRSRVSSRTR